MGADARAGIGTVARDTGASLVGADARAFCREICAAAQLLLRGGDRQIVDLAEGAIRAERGEHEAKNREHQALDQHYRATTLPGAGWLILRGSSRVAVLPQRS